MTPRERPREPRETPRPRGPRPPSWEDPAHPANPAPPFRGAGLPAGSGGLAAAPIARPAGADPAARGLHGSLGEGWSAVGWRVGSPPKHRTILAYPGVTLSDENAPSRSRASDTRGRPPTPPYRPPTAARRPVAAAPGASPARLTLR